MAKKSKEELQKEEKLQETLAQITTRFGKGSVISAEEQASYGDVIPVTSFSLGNSLGIGGFAKRKLYVIDGAPSGGKSTTSYDVIGNCQKTYGDNCLLVDKEDSYSVDYGKKLGVDNSKLTIVRPHTQEDMYDLLEMSLKSNAFGCILIDSVTSFAPQAKYEGNATLGLEARINSDKMRMVMDALQNSNTCLIMILQTRQKIGAYGDPTTNNGGEAIPFYSHVRIRITRSEIDRENEQNLMKFTVIKNKLAKPFKVGTVVYDWNKGFNVISEIGDLSIEFGIIKLEGKSYYLPETEIKIVGKKNLLQHLDDNMEYVETVLKPKVEAHLSNNNLRTEDLIEDLVK